MGRRPLHFLQRAHATMQTHAAHLSQTSSRVVSTRSVLKVKFVLLASLYRIHRDKGAVHRDKGAWWTPNRNKL